MRCILLLMLLVTLAGCKTTIGPLASKKRDQKPDPLYDINQQKTWARERFPYFDDNKDLYPNTYSDRPGNFGR